jgi:hypothetical protein
MRMKKVSSLGYEKEMDYEKKVDALTKMQII